MENSKNNSWKKPLIIGLVILGILVAAGYFFVTYADFHVVAIVFQLIIPLLILEFLPILIVGGGLILVMKLVFSSRKSV